MEYKYCNKLQEAALHNRLGKKEKEETGTSIA